MYDGTVAEVMCTVVHEITPTTPAAEAVRLIGSYRYHAVLVSERQAVVGIITESDILPALHQADFADLSAGQLMSQPVRTVAPTTRISEALAILEEHQIRHLVVADPGGVYGICTRHEIIRAFNNKLYPAQPREDQGGTGRQDPGAANLGGLLSTDGTLLAATESALQLLGLQLADVIGRPFWETAWWSHDGALQEQLRIAVARAAAGETVRMKVSHQIPAGELRIIDFSLAPIHDAAGEVIYLLPQGNDITDYQHYANQLQESEARFRQLFEKSRAVELLIDPDSGDIIDANEAAALFYGGSRDELRRQSIWQINTLTRDQVQAEILLAKSEKRDHFFFKHRLFDGSLRDVEVHSGPLQIDGKQVLYSIIHDVTERKQAERLQAGHQRVLEMLLSNDHQLPDVLQAIAHIAEEQTPGMRASILLLRGDRLYQGAAPRLPKAYNAAVEGYAIGPDRGACGTAAALGERVIVEDIASDPKWAEYRDFTLAFGLRACWSQPIKDAQGQVLGTFAMYYTERKRPCVAELRLIEAMAGLAGVAIERFRALEALRASESRFSAIFNASSVGVAITSTDGRLLEVNERLARMLEYTPETLAGLTVAQITHPDDCAYSRANLLAMSQGRQLALALEKRYLTRSGKVIWGHLTVARLHDESGRLSAFLSMIQDITERKISEAMLAEKQRFLQAVVDGVADPIMVVGRHYEILLANKAAAKQYDANVACRKQLRQCQSLCLLCRSGSEEINCPMEQIVADGQPSKLVHSLKRPDGSQRMIELIATPLLSPDGELECIVESSRDITEHLELVEALREKEKHLDYLARRDLLTGLPNRLMFTDRLEHCITQAQRKQGRLALLFIDLDRFKQINDSFGHQIGDLVLQEAARRLTRSLREVDSIARLGGDEFTAILEEVGQPEDAGRVAEKLLAALHQPFLYHDQSLFLGASIGISLFPDDGASAAELMRNADAAMYGAKTAGRNTHRYYQASMTELAVHRVKLEAALRSAVANREFCLVYQPQIDLRSGRFYGLEALLRWQHPQLGLLEPEHFLPIAEESGLILQIGEWVLQEACTRMRELTLQPGAPRRMAVNLSGHQLRQPDFVNRVRSILQESGCPPQLIQLEITENAITGNPEQFIPILRALKATGASLAIDDFGTGTTSLGHLKLLPIDELKIDRSFVRDIPQDKDDEAIVRAVIALAQSLGMEVIAEGVENPLQQAFLQRHGCHQAQGYYYSRPQPLATLILGRTPADAEL